MQKGEALDKTLIKIIILYSTDGITACIKLLKTYSHGYVFSQLAEANDNHIGYITKMMVF